MSWTWDWKENLSAFSAGVAVVSAMMAWRGQRWQYFHELRKWADESCTNLSKALHACELKPVSMPPGAFFALRHDLLIALSAQIDRGRWFFPNLKYPGVGEEKEHAFRGVRQPALDSLVHSYRIVKSLDYQAQDPNRARRKALVKLKRKFVSEIQIYLNPKDRTRQFSGLMNYSGSPRRQSW